MRLHLSRISPLRSSSLQIRAHSSGLDALASGMHHYVSRERRLVGIGDAGEVIDLARQCALVQPFHIAIDKNVNRALDEYLDKIGEPPLQFVAGPRGRERWRRRAR